MPLAMLAICDDVRFEMGHKLTLVGFYGRSVQVSSLPANLPKLCVFAQFSAPFPEQQVFATRLVGPGGNLILEVSDQKFPTLEGIVSDVPAEYRQVHLVFVVSPMLLNEHGAYRVEYSFQGGPKFQADFFVGIEPPPADGEGKRR